MGWSCRPVSQEVETAQVQEDTVAQKPDIQYDRYWNDLARYLGGLEPLAGSVLDSIDYRPEAIRHREFINKEWRVKDSLLIRPLSAWSRTELAAEYQSNRTVYYPFSGPDFVTVVTLFPKANRYVMFGLEIEGNIPRILALPKDRLSFNLTNLQNSVIDNIRDSFFYTLDMSSDLLRSDLKGTIPILLFMLARSDKEVLEVKRIKIDPMGSIEYLNEDDPTPQTPNDNVATGVEILFRDSPRAEVQSIQYFCFNAEDKHFQQQKQIHTFFQSLKPTTTYLKSASYLMHNFNFSIIRNIVIDVSDFLLQDDTGIGYRFLDPKVWDFSYYGNYTRPIPLFANYYQSDLSEAFKAGQPKPLTFNMGYKSSTNLLAARRRPLPASSTEQNPMP
jgi:hypothetical protein